MLEPDGSHDLLLPDLGDTVLDIAYVQYGGGRQLQQMDQTAGWLEKLVSVKLVSVLQMLTMTSQVTVVQQLYQS